MKHIFYSKLFLFLITLFLLSLVACSADGGNVYNYLQHQDIIKGNIVDNSNISGSQNGTEPFIQGGVFEHLEKNNFKLNSVKNNSSVEEGS